MKLSLAIISVLFVSSLNLPAFAQDWDMQPSGATVPVAQELISAPQVEQSAVSSTGYDLSALTSSNVGNTTNLTGSMDNVPHTTGKTGNQQIAGLPLCRTHTLFRISGPIASNGLPPCNLDSFVKNSGFSDEIYGDEGADGKPPLEHFASINSGIKGDTAAGLTTGQAQ